MKRHKTIVSKSKGNAGMYKGYKKGIIKLMSIVVVIALILVAFKAPSNTIGEYIPTAIAMFITVLLIAVDSDKSFLPKRAGIKIRVATAIALTFCGTLALVLEERVAIGSAKEAFIMQCLRQEKTTPNQLPKECLLYLDKKS